MSQTTKDYRELDPQRLIIKIQDLESDFYAWREQVRAGKEKSHARLKFLKKEVARAKTVLNERIN